MTEFLPEVQRLNKLDKAFFLNVVNTCFPYYIDELVVDLIKKKQTKSDHRDNYIELSSEFRNIFKTELFNIQTSRFLNLLTKRNEVI